MAAPRRRASPFRTIGLVLLAFGGGLLVGVGFEAPAIWLMRMELPVKTVELGLSPGAPPSGRALARRAAGQPAVTATRPAAQPSSARTRGSNRPVAPGIAPSERAVPEPVLSERSAAPASSWRAAALEQPAASRAVETPDERGSARTATVSKSATAPARVPPALPAPAARTAQPAVPATPAGATRGVAQAAPGRAALHEAKVRRAPALARPAPAKKAARGARPSARREVQVATTPNRAGAQALVRELRSKHLDAYMIGKRKLLLVRVRPAGQESAQRTAERLEQLGFDDAMIVGE